MTAMRVSGKKGMELSKRMYAVAGMVPTGCVAADVGCDHGFVSVYLAKHHICPHVYAADVRPGPLARAKEHIERNGVSGAVTPVLSDGLQKVPVGEGGGPLPGTDVMIAAGMGGRLIVRILRDFPKKTARLSWVVLEPQSEPWLVRRWLAENGFVITREKLVLEDQKYYPVIQACNTRIAGQNGEMRAKTQCMAAAKEKERLLGEMEAAGIAQDRWHWACDWLGPVLLAQKPAVLLSFLEHTIHKDQELLLHLPDAGNQTLWEGRIAARRKELEERIGLCGQLLLLWNDCRKGVQSYGKEPTMTLNVDGREVSFEQGMTYEQIAQTVQEGYAHKIVLAVANGKIRELFKQAADAETVRFLTSANKIGHDTYVRSATMLLMKAVSDVLGEKQSGTLKVEFSIGKGLYCSPRGDLRVDSALTQKVEERMRKLVAAKLRFTKAVWPTDSAVKLFSDRGMRDKVQLFKYRRGSNVNVYCLDGYYDYYYGYMVPDTGYLSWFELIPYRNGLMMMLPSVLEPEKTPSFEERRKLFDTLEASAEWGSRIGIDTVGDLNDKICSGDLAELILVQEAMQESRIGYIADEIASRPDVKFVMIAGPSSSGKTTFSHRLSIQLKARGLKPHPIAMDNYFVNREQTPKDADGNYNFECLEAIDVEQFNRDMCGLLEGKTVEMPVFNFKSGKREYNGNLLKLGQDDILVIEGIHGLNEKMSHSLPAESKYKIYISALTSLNVDEHNRIPTTDGRLLRRMVRDDRTRGISAQQTLARWASVRRGEEENIFPYQESADVMFNSALIYELCVLKTYAEPLLYSIKKEDPEYFEAKRLLKFLDYFLGVSSENVPINSIVREFVGGSCFRV